MCEREVRARVELSECEREVRVRGELSEREREVRVRVESGLRVSRWRAFSIDSFSSSSRTSLSLV